MLKILEMQDKLYTFLQVLSKEKDHHCQLQDFLASKTQRKRAIALARRNQNQDIKINI